MLNTSRLISLRKQHSFTQAEMAQRLNTSRPNYVRYERGNHQPPNEILGMMGEIFGVSVDYLLGKTDDPTPPDKKKSPPTLEEVERLYLEMLMQEKGTSIENLVLTEDDKRQLRGALQAMIRGYGSE